jgi:hypothetical protein
MNAADQNAILSDILAAWHAWAQGDRQSIGFANVSAGMGDWRCSRQHDFDNGAIDAEVDRSIHKTVDFHVREMADPYRAAIYMNAKNLSAGRNVFQSLRVPTGIEGANILRTAREALTLKLVGAGVI